jgi:hypothetical protein
VGSATFGILQCTADGTGHTLPILETAVINSSIHTQSSKGLQSMAEEMDGDPSQSQNTRVQSSALSC